LLKITILALIAADLALAQQPEKLSFQTASIHSNELREGHCAPSSSVAGQTLTLRNCALGELILFAYNVLQRQVTGETSLLNEHYDITAKSDQALSSAQARRMLQSLLTDRFKLTFRRETKEMPVYALLPGLDGPKFQVSPTASDAGPKPTKGSAGELIFQNMAMSDLVFALSRRLPDRQVVDKTGLEGKYDMDMTWYLNLGKKDPPSVFTAIQELGLKLEPQNNSVEFLIIVSVSKPSEN
jgi:uncharacterized protein (TIGR03435 family)